MNRRLSGKTVVFSGGTAGLGKKIALRLAEEGANLVLMTHNITAAEEMVKEIEAVGSKAIYLSCEITSEVQLIEMIEKTVQTFGSIDIAINNAGYGPKVEAYPSISIDELSEEQWDKYIENCLKGIFLSVKQEIRYMKIQKQGVIINTAMEGFMPRANTSLYSIAKAGTKALTACAAEENKDTGIRIHMVYSEKIFLSDQEEENLAELFADLCADDPCNINGSILRGDE